MEELLPRNEAIKHILHHGKSDPNLLIYNHYLGVKTGDKAEKFLAYRQLWEAVRKGEKVTAFPPHVAIGLSDMCNLHCAHCYREFNRDKTPKRKLEYKEVVRLIDECKDIGVPSIGLGTESEMFLYDRIIDLLQYIGGKNFEDFWACTNGTLLDEQHINAILSCNITRLSISIDAVSNATYRNVRGKHYYKLLSNIFNFLDKREQLRSAIPVLRVTMVRSNLTAGECDDFIGFWSKIADEVDIQPLIDVKNIDGLRYDSIEEPHCNYPWSMLYINWNGDYKPCCSEYCKHLTIGNMAEMSIKEAWNSDYLKDLRQQFVSKRINKVCINCLRSLNSLSEYTPIGDNRISP